MIEIEKNFDLRPGDRKRLIVGAEKRILEFAKENGIAGTEGRGNAIEYIARNRPEYCAALVARGVIYGHQ